MFEKTVFKNYSSFIYLFSRVTDPILVVLAAIVAYGINFSFANLHLSQDYRALIVFAVFCVVLVFPLFNIYTSWRGQSLPKQARAVIMAWISVIITMVVILFMLEVSNEYSRLWLGLWALIGGVFLLAFRMCIYVFLQYQRNQGKNYRRVVVVGAGDLAHKLVNQTMDAPWSGFKITALFDDDAQLHNTSIRDVAVLGSIDKVATYVENTHIDEVWIALPLRAEAKVKELLYALRHQTVNVKLVPDIFGFSLLNHSMTEIVGLPAVNLSDTPMHGWNRAVKVIEDRVLALLILILISPLLLLIVVAVKMTSPGPALFKQKRHGWDGRIINVYKFRTMKVHSEEHGKVTQACKGDARITPFGAFLRCTSLDELPQFYNVLQGRMSIVGPRPHPIAHNEIYKDQVNQYMLRHMVKPGITGWAQINGLRGETDTLDKMKNRVEYDLYYIENWSLWLDLKIIFMTLYKGFLNDNAY